MKVDVQNEKRDFINADEVNKRTKDFLQFLKRNLGIINEKVQTEIIPMVKDWYNVISESILAPIVEEHCELLTMEDLASIVKANRVESSNANITYKKMNDDGSFIIIITYLQNNVIMDSSVNKTIAIYCDGISREIKDMFGTNDIIIMN